VFANTFGMAQVTLNPKPLTKDVSEITTTEAQTDSIFNSEVKLVEGDSISNDSILKPKSFLEGIVDYKAKDYTSINQKTQQIYLYNEAEIQYKDMDIKAGVIIIDYGKDIIYAGRLKDSLGIYSQHPVFKQGNDLVEPDSIAFNIKTKKALIWNSKTEQQGGRIISELTKKENDSVYFVKRAKFTTS
jgi:lipopolysaccharide assembly outer membrane protein LptD (OstA)